MSRSFLIVLAAAIAVPLLAITGDSLWIDELMSAYLATAESIDGTDGYDFRVGKLNSSDIQMPIYMFYIYLWENAFGHSEWAMRMANLPWFVFGIAALWHLLREAKRLRAITIALVLVSPFAWYYLNEVRPYAMQLGASCAVFGCAARVVWGGLKLGTADLVYTLAGLIGMAGASLLSAPWIGMFLLLIAWAAVRGRIVAPAFVSIGLAAIAVIALARLGVYYAGTLMEGASPTPAGGGLIQGFAFAFYELFGFAGLGPGRTALRESGIAVFGAAEIVGVGMLAAVYIAIVIAFFLSRPKLDRWSFQIVTTAVLIALPLLFFLLVGFVKDFRVLGRHLAPLLPAIALGVAGLLCSIRSTKAVVALLVLLLASSISLRVFERHQRDDYRQAAQLVAEEVAAGRDVLWCANLASFSYYGPFVDGAIPIEVRPRPVGEGGGETMHTWRFGNDAGQPDMVLLSKPKIHDRTGHARRVIQAGGFRLEHTFPGFEVWVR